MATNRNENVNVNTKVNVKETRVSRERVEEMLREIAFVLHMTRRVRDQIKTEEEADEYALV